MKFTNEEKIEISKIIIGLFLSVVGGLWTYTTYTESARNNELETIIALGNSVAGMHVTCKGKFKGLAELANTKIKREKKCYVYFEDAYRRSLSSMIIIAKPIMLPTNDWKALWSNLQKVLQEAASQKYEKTSIDKAWNDILVAKGLSDNGA